MPTNSASTKPKRNRRQRGYSLIEVAIALAIVGVVMGGIAIPIGNQLREQVYQRADTQVGTIVDAIIGYAIANRTNGQTLIHSNYGDTNIDIMRFYGHRITDIPAGRPFLPCPDIDNDGYEDRLSGITKQLLPSRQGSSIIARGAFDDRFNSLNSLDVNRYSGINSFDNVTLGGRTTGRLPMGSCLKYFGSVPYKTLGIKAGDPWGKAHTYVVHPNFAAAGFGFDQATRTETILKNYETNVVGPIFLDGSIVPMIGNYAMGERPFLVCPLDEPTSFNGCNQDHSHSSLDVAKKGFETGTANGFGLNAALNNRYSSIATYLTYTAPVGFIANYYSWQHPLSRVTDGIPFAVISHGIDNGGAHDALVPCTVPAIFSGSRPRQALANDVNQSVNLAVAACSQAPIISGYENSSNTKLTRISGSTFNIPGGSNPSAHNAIYYNWIYAQQRASTTGNDTFVGGAFREFNYADKFDDVVTWLTRRELAARMRRAGVFPLNETFAGLYSYLATYKYSS